jgi:hypothetical protein
MNFSNFSDSLLRRDDGRDISLVGNSIGGGSLKKILSKKNVAQTGATLKVIHLRIFPIIYFELTKQNKNKDKLFQS